MQSAPQVGPQIAPQAAHAALCSACQPPCHSTASSNLPEQQPALPHSHPQRCCCSQQNQGGMSWGRTPRWCRLGAAHWVL
jgi:hypothetical protein